MSISNFILNDPLIEIVVKLSVIECYLHQVDVSAHPLNILVHSEKTTAPLRGPFPCSQIYTKLSHAH